MSASKASVAWAQTDAATSPHLPIVLIAHGLSIARGLPEQHLHEQQRRHALPHAPLQCRLLHCCLPLWRGSASILISCIFTWSGTQIVGDSQAGQCMPGLSAA